MTAGSTAALGAESLTITGTSGTQTSPTVIPLIVQAPTFTIVDYDGLSLVHGTSTTSYVFIQPVNSFNGSVNLAVTGLPSGVPATFSLNPTTANRSRN